MNLSRLKRANEYDVRKWLSEELDLTPYQRQKLRDDDMIRLAPFEFYEDCQKEKVPFWWRFTLLVIPVYIVLVWVFILLKFIVTGNRYLPQKYIDSIHNPWMRKLNIHL